MSLSDCSGDYFLGLKLPQDLSLCERPRHSGGAAQLTQSIFGIVSDVKIEINLLRPNSTWDLMVAQRVSFVFSLFFDIG